MLTIPKTPQSIPACRDLVCDVLQLCKYAGLPKAGLLLPNSLTGINYVIT